MQTTVELSDHLFSLAQAKAEERGISLTQWLTEAVTEKLQTGQAGAARPWMAFAGQLQDLRQETIRINALIDQEFERLEPEDRA